MTLKQAEGFYAVHRERPFFGGLTEFMSSAPCVVMALEKERRSESLARSDGRHRSGES